MTEYRLYTFTNMYLSDIQRGIQSAHLVHTLFTDWMFEDHHDPAWQALIAWAQKDKTMIVLDGGYSSNLAEIYGALCHVAEELGLPYAEWFEGQDALDGARTCVGVIVPAEIYEAKLNPLTDNAVYITDDGTHLILKDAMRELYDIIKGYQLA